LAGVQRKLRPLGRGSSRVIALFVIKKSIALLLAAIVAIIAGYFFAVSTIAKEES